MNQEWLILKGILEDKKFFKCVSNAFNKDLFDDRIISDIFEVVRNHYSQYTTIPSQDIIKQSVKGSEDLLAEVNKMDFDITNNNQYLYDETNKYLKDQSVKRALMESVNVIEGGKDLLLIKELMDKALEKDMNPKKHEIIDMSDLVYMDFPEIRMFVENVIPEGVTIMAGKAKIGKSRLALNIMADIISGQKAIGGFDTKKSDVLFMALEDPFRRMKKNGTNIMSDYPKGLGIVCEWSPGQQGRDDLEKYLDLNPNIRVIVVDPLSKMRDKGNPRSPYQSDYNEIDAWSQIAKARRISIVIIHHLKKGMEEDPLDLLNGTSGLAAAADNVIILKQENQKNCNAFMYIRGNDLPNEEWALSFDGEKWHYEGRAEDYKGTQVQNQILQDFDDDEDITPKEITNRIEMNYDYAKKSIRRMVDSGILKKIGRGRYRKL